MTALPQIRLIENQLINKIAAGEVVERPASVVKELIENSIDAHSRMITVEIKDGGSTYIKITDNGGGIPPEQLRTAFMRHATSKITDLESLENVMTLGFRGEALSSIAGVAQVEVLTKTKDNAVGARIEIHGGEIISESEAGCADGTSFLVRNLFFNTPARKKFMKTNSAESAYITELVNRIALSHPEIAFKYINNSSTLLQTNGNGEIKAAALAVYGKEAVMKMLEVNDSFKGLALKGLVAKPEFNRSNRQYCNFFINKRYIRSDILQSAAEEAYKTRLPIGRFPVFALELSISPNEVDVNVHPTKLDVRFSDESSVYQFIVNSLKGVLQKEILVSHPNPAFFNEKKQAAVAVAVTIQQNEPVLNEREKVRGDVKRQFTEEALVTEELPPIRDIPPVKESIPLPATLPLTTYKKTSPSPSVFDLSEKKDYQANTNSNLNVNVNINASPPPIQKAEPVTTPFFYNYVIAGQIFATYWIVEQEQKVYLIDQHAAHERVLFEELAQKLKKSAVLQQKLITPFALRLSPVEMNAVSENIELLEKIGFELEVFGEDTYALRAVPYLFKNPVEFSYFNEILDMFIKTDKACLLNAYDNRLDAIAMISCKAAVKGNDRLSYPEAKALIDKILKLENPFTCPHGRPTIVEMTKNDIEKMFKRT